MDYDNEINQRYYYKSITLVCVSIVLCFLIYYLAHAYDQHKMISSGYEYRKVVIGETTTIEYDWQWTKQSDSYIGVEKNKPEVGL